MGEVDDGIARRPGVRPIGERRGPEDVPDWRGWSEWDLKKCESVGVEGRW